MGLDVRLIHWNPLPDTTGGSAFKHPGWLAAAIERYYRNRIETVDALLESMKGETEALRSLLRVDPDVDMIGGCVTWRPPGCLMFKRTI